MDIDAIIAEAIPDAKEQEIAQGEPAQPVTEDKKPEIKLDSELTPEQLDKREQNRKSHQTRHEVRTKNKLRELEAKIASLTQGSQPNPAETKKPDGAPKEEDYQDYTQFIRDTARYEAKQVNPDKPVETAPQAIDAKVVHKIGAVKQREEEFSKLASDYTELCEQNADFLKHIPKQVAEALIEADDPTLAIYSLMKDGTLEDLADMSPFRMAMTIQKAESAGQSYLNKPKPTTNAPTPLTPAKGNVSGIKSTSSMSFEELKKELGLK